MTVTLKRFYTDVALIPNADGAPLMTLALDGNPVLTPARRTLTIAHPRLAAGIAKEWEAQGAKVELSTMPMTRLAMSVNDHVAPRLDAVREEALSYGKTDLLCYRAAEPERLFERQSLAWQPYVDWATDALGAPLKATLDIKAIEQDPASVAALGNAIAILDSYRLLALHTLTTKFGSLVLGLAVLHGRANAVEALTVSRLDEIFQAEIWGADWEAERRTEAVAREVEDLAQFLALLD